MNKKDLLSKYESKLILKNYSDRTVEFYLYSQKKLNYGYSMMKQLLASIKFLYQEVLKEPFDFDFNYTDLYPC